MEVDSDLEEPVVKRMNIPTERHNPRSRTMMADRVEIGHQLGKRIDDGYGVGNSNIHERLGGSNELNNHNHCYLEYLKNNIFIQFSINISTAINKCSTADW